MDNPIICIYCIKDKRTNKIIYIGKTQNFKQRYSEHFRKSVTPIDKFMLDNNRDNFEMFPIKIFDKLPNNFHEYEQKFIDKYDTINNGLNIVPAKGLARTSPYRHKYITTPEYRKKNNAYMKKYRQTEKYKQYTREYYSRNKG